MLPTGPFNPDPPIIFLGLRFDEDQSTWLKAFRFWRRRPWGELRHDIFSSRRLFSRGEIVGRLNKAPKFLIGDFCHIHPERIDLDLMNGTFIRSSALGFTAHGKGPPRDQRHTGRIRRSGKRLIEK